MNLLLFTNADRVNAGCIEVSDRRLQHLIEVHKAKVGDQVRVGEVDGNTGSGEILELNAHKATLSVALNEAPPQKLPIHLVLALPRPKMLRRILRSTAEFGVPQLHLINSYRVEKSYWQTPALKPETIREYLVQGLEQAKDTVLPTVTCHERFKPFVEDTFPAIINKKEGLLAHPGAYPMAPSGPRPDTVLIIGPEGGFIPYEVEKFQQAGCATVSLGPRILRVENAVNSLLGRLS